MDEPQNITRAKRGKTKVPIMQEIDAVTLLMTVGEAWSLERAIQSILELPEHKLNYALTPVGRQRLSNIAVALRTVMHRY